MYLTITWETCAVVYLSESTMRVINVISNNNNGETTRRSFISVYHMSFAVTEECRAAIIQTSAAAKLTLDYNNTFVGK